MVLFVLATEESSFSCKGRKFDKSLQYVFPKTTGHLALWIIKKTLLSALLSNLIIFILEQRILCWLEHDRVICFCMESKMDQVWLIVVLVIRGCLTHNIFHGKCESFE